MTVFDGLRNEHQPLPLWAEIIGCAIFGFCVLAWTVVVIGAAVAMGAV